MSYKELTEQLGEGNEALTLVKAVSEEIPFNLKGGGLCFFSKKIF
jgi:hypothetical protein